VAGPGFHEVAPRTLEVLEPVGNPPLPASLAESVRLEFGRAFRAPYEVPSVVFGNGLLMTACWTLLPASVVAWVFTLHGPVAFALVLASWMYSDVPATNLLGSEPERTIAALDDRRMLRRLWYGKNLVLWLFITPLCTVVAVAIGIHDRSVTLALLSLVWIAAVPLGALGFSAWLGIWYPYHELPLRYRWDKRRRWRPLVVRWLVLVLVPYGLVPALTVVLSLPTLALWTAESPSGDRGRLSDVQVAWGLVIAVPLALIAWFVGHRIGARLAQRRREKLEAFLADPDRG
jgi:hypothetical protein